MKKIIREIKDLKKTEIKDIIDKRMYEFRKRRNEDELFSELCFCLLTANFSAERAIRIQEEIKNGFFQLSESDLAKKLRELGYRFPNTRAKYIAEARRHKSQLRRVTSYQNARDWLVKNVKGLGYKEASHFLRNIGYSEFAIIDFHIIDILADNGIIRRPKNLSKKAYLDIEDCLRDMGKKAKLSLGELDLYLWYMETSKVLK